MNPKTIDLAGVSLHLSSSVHLPGETSAETTATPSYYSEPNENGERSFLWRYGPNEGHCSSQWGCALYLGGVTVGGVEPTIEALDATVRERIARARIALQVEANAGAALLRIHAAMSGRMWDADTMQEVADVLQSVGLVVAPPSEAS